MQGNGYDSGGGTGDGSGGGGKPFRYRDLVQVQWSARADNRYVFDRNGQRRRRRVHRNRHIKGRLVFLAITVVLVAIGSNMHHH